MDKIRKNSDTLVPIITGLRSQGKRVVLALGVFDLLHAGHVRFLADAKIRGDYLVVGIQDDPAVRRTKGNGRPLLPAGERAEVLAALTPVSYVTVFGETDGSALVRKLRPDFVARGRDYTEKTVPEREAAEEVGSKVVLCGDARTYSVLRILEQSRKKKPSGSPRVARA